MGICAIEVEVADTFDCLKYLPPPGMPAGVWLWRKDLGKLSSEVKLSSALTLVPCPPKLWRQKVSPYKSGPEDKPLSACGPWSFKA